MNTDIYSMLHERIFKFMVHLAETGTERHLIADALWEL